MDDKMELSDAEPLWLAPQHSTWHTTPMARLTQSILRLLGIFAFWNVYKEGRAWLLLWIVCVMVPWKHHASRPAWWKLVCLGGFLLSTWKMLIYLIAARFLGLVLMWMSAMFLFPRFRFYMFSFVHDELYEWRELSQCLGILYKNDVEWKTNRNDTCIWMDGLFVNMIKWVTGMEFVLSLQTKSAFMKLQRELMQKMDLRPYFILATGEIVSGEEHFRFPTLTRGLVGKTMSLMQFEDFLSRVLLRESNRVFEVVDDNVEEEFAQCLSIVRIIMNGLTTDLPLGYRTYLSSLPTIYKISRILKSVPEEKRLFLHVPQLAFIHNFGKYVAKSMGQMGTVRRTDFLLPISKYFVLIHKGQLCFVDRHRDLSDKENNRSFGPYGLQCPGAHYSYELITKALDILKKDLDIKVHGIPKWYIGRFESILNKADLQVSFSCKRE